MAYRVEAKGPSSSGHQARGRQGGHDLGIAAISHASHELDRPSGRSLDVPGRATPHDDFVGGS
jgi:hypothetical protein